LMGTAIYPKGWLDYALRSLVGALLGEALYHLHSRLRRQRQRVG
jgi:hypothetical protein